MATTTPLKIRLPKPHSAQQQVLNRTKRFNLVVAGEDAGKTALGIEVLLASKYGALNSRQPVAWFSATDDELVKARRRIMSAIEPLVKRRPNARRIELSTGGAIDFYSLETTRDAFGEYQLIVVDDARKVPNLMDLWIDTLQPLVQKRSGHAWFLSEAYGKRNDVYAMWEMAGEDPVSWTRHRFDSFQNPHLPEETEKASALATEPEYLQRFQAEFLDVAFEFTDEQRLVAPGETFLQWCERLEQTGLKVDGQPFTLSDRPTMRFIYSLIPSTVEEAFEKMTVLMKCAQVGFTVAEMLAMIYLALRFSPAKVGMFMPAQSAATGKSSGRFMPIVRSIPDVHKLMVDAKGGEGNVLVRDMGGSRFHFLWTTGKVSTESNPMDVVSFDEVQEMAIADMEKTRERLSASKIRYTLMGSTANWPDEDIHHWFKKGKQYHFHTKCPGCGVGQVLDEHFPECIGFDPSAPRLGGGKKPIIQANGSMVLGEYRYRCHACKGWIDDPQQGEWLARDPTADIDSVHYPQCLSPTISPRNMIEAYRDADDMKNFFNRKLGKPYTDPSQVPVNLEMLNDCAAAGMAAGLVWKTRARGTFMGLDQMGNFIVAVIKERMPDGRQAVVHLEYIYISPTKEDPEATPWRRCDELMAAYGVQVCVVETLPNYDSAKSFARRHDGKVFLAGYGNMDGDMLLWGDTPTTSTSDRRTTDEAQDRYTVRLDQYKCMQVSMSRFASKTCLFPDPTGLVQEVLEKGQRKLSEVCKEQAFFHFTRTALVAEKDEEEKKFRRRVVKVGIDPHTSYANMLCDVAWARAHGTSTFILPDTKPALGTLPQADSVATIPGLGDALQAAQEALANTCGGCINRDPDTGMCSEVGMRTRPNTPSCIAFASGS